MLRNSYEVPPGNDVDTEGEGDILRIISRPQTGSRTIDMDADNFTVTDEHMETLPRSYVVQQYGYNPKKLALSFDDGPDPIWTPKILDVLKQYNVKGTFMVIGEQAQDNVGLLSATCAKVTRSAITPSRIRTSAKYRTASCNWS